MKGEDSDSDNEEDDDDLPSAFADMQQNESSTLTEHEVQDGLEEKATCTVNTILPYVTQQNPSVEQRRETSPSGNNHSTLSSSGIFNGVL